MTTTPGGSKNVLGSDVEIKGELKFSGEMTFEGKIDGEIKGEGVLTLGDSSVVNGNIETQTALLRGGKITGNITTREKLEVKGKTELFGDIRAARLSIEEGVTFVGRVDVNPNKLSSTPPPARGGEPAKGTGPAPDAPKLR
ncbi:MAG: bactofilin family protein [Limisphaerales bacterium]